MSQALQRVIVRLLHDPAYVTAIYGGAPTPELSASERRMLLEADHRAWGADPYRRSRGLRALIEEFPASSAVASGGGSRLGALDAFFSSTAFHEAVQQRGSLALAYGSWLPRGPLARLETALADARRRQRPFPTRGDGTLVCCAPGVAPITVPDGTLARWQAVRERLGAEPLAALVAHVDLRDLPPVGQGEEHWITWPAPGGDLSVGGGSSGVNAVLAAALAPTARAHLEEVAVGLGAHPNDAPGIVADLIADGLLVDG